MATILKHIADDILTSLKQTFDDEEIQRSQVVYWIILIGNRLKSLHIQKRSSGAFLSTFIVPVIIGADGRKYFLLPKSIYDYDNDKAIHFVAYKSSGEIGCPPRFTRTTFSRTTIKKSEWLYKSEYTTPSAFEPYFYRVSNNIFSLGLEKVDVPELEIGLFTALDPLTEIDINAPFDFPDELIGQLKREVLDLGRFVLLVPEERKNNGKDDITTSQVPTNKIISVQPDQQQPDQQ